MAMINIIPSNDVFYRYKRPATCLRYETNFTLIVNVDNIAKSLGRTTNDLIKFIKINLSTSVSKKGLRGVWSVNEIDEAINLFIKYFILCKHCSNPETTTKNILICKACSNKTVISCNKITSKML